MKAQRTVLIVAYYFFMTLGVIRACLFAQQTLSDFGLNICTALCATLACIADSKLVGRPMPHAAKWVMFFVWPIAVPIYLLWARGRRGAVLLLIHLVATAGIVIGVAWVMFGVMQIEPR